MEEHDGVGWPHIVPEWLLLYAGGHLPDTDVDRLCDLALAFEAHMAKCPVCTVVVNSYRKVHLTPEAVSEVRAKLGDYPMDDGNTAAILFGTQESAVWVVLPYDLEHNPSFCLTPPSATLKPAAVLLPTNLAVPLAMALVPVGRLHSEQYIDLGVTCARLALTGGPFAPPTEDAPPSGIVVAH